MDNPSSNMFIVFCNVIIILFSLSDVLTLNLQSLEGQWSVFNKNNSINIPAKVPGGIYSNLQSMKVIDDIYFRFNDLNYRWVANESWTYVYVFNASENHFKETYSELVFDGLDTFATIYFNNVLLGSTNSMFVRYVFDIKPYLKDEFNNIKVAFKSPIIEANTAHLESNYIVPPLCVPKIYNGECHVNLIRKMQASFSWDWGPAFPSIGIWKPVYIRSYSSAIVQDIIVDIKEDGDNIEYWNINLNVYLNSNASYIEGLLTTKLNTDINEVKIFSAVNETIKNKEYLHKTNIYIPKAHVNLWWPNGFGSQNLYKLTVTFSSLSGKDISVKQIKIGFRTIELIQNEVAKGLTFYFKVNNIPIFMKGSNWIPANILPEKGADINDLRFLLQSAKDVHMNMLRVWGGGIYESDEFYQLADEMGILIWQDFMFACSMYPTEKKFLDLVKVEVEQQVRRLQHHPSIAVWAGNNENEAALRDNWYGTATNFSLYKRDYVKLYVNTIKKVCEENDPTRTYLVSSPSNGLESEKEGFVAQYPYDTHYGDIHYYNYLANGWDQNTYLRARFSSEYGFQSIPAYETLLSSTNNLTDLKMKSKFLESRQHHLGGYDEMKIMIIRNMNLPKEKTSNYFKTFIYFSQISQAMAYKAQTEYYRQWRSRMDDLGNGLTMGALYWQLNDVWPAPSWSSIDFRHRWKMVHYFAKKFFAPLLISANLDRADQVTVYSLSDLTEIVPNAILTISVYNWTQMNPVATQNISLNILPGYSGIVTQFWLEKYLEKIEKCGNFSNVKNNCFLYFELRNSEGKIISPENFLYPVGFKNVKGLSTPNLSIQLSLPKGHNTKPKSSVFKITVFTDRITPFVWLNTGKIKGRFSDNGFLMVSKLKRLYFYSDEPTDLDALLEAIKITSLMNREHL